MATKKRRVEDSGVLRRHAPESAQSLAEHKQAETALGEVERRLLTVFANVPLVLFAIDQEGIFTLSEGKGLAALGLEPGK